MIPNLYIGNVFFFRFLCQSGDSTIPVATNGVVVSLAAVKAVFSRTGDGGTVWMARFGPLWKPWKITPPKSNINTKNDGFKNVSPFKYGYFGYPC